MTRGRGQVCAADHLQGLGQAGRHSAGSGRVRVPRPGRKPRCSERTLPHLPDEGRQQVHDGRSALGLVRVEQVPVSSVGAGSGLGCWKRGYGQVCVWGGRYACTLCLCMCVYMCARVRGVCVFVCSRVGVCLTRLNLGRLRVPMCICTYTCVQLCMHVAHVCVRARVSVCASLVCASVLVCASLWSLPACPPVCLCFCASACVYVHARMSMSMHARTQIFTIHPPSSKVLMISTLIHALSILLMMHPLVYVA